MNKPIAHLFVEKRQVQGIKFSGNRLPEDSSDDAWEADTYLETSNEAIEFWSGKNRTLPAALEMLKKCNFEVYAEIDGVSSQEAL